MLHVKTFPLFSAQSLGSTFKSNALDLAVYYGASIQAIWTGNTAAGSLSLQYSNVYLPGASTNDSDWSTDANSTQTVSGPGNFFFDLTTTQGRYVRLLFVPSAGTGSMSAYVNGKTP